MQSLNAIMTDEPVTGDEHARIHTAQIMSEYLFSLSMMCKHYEWHKTGLHLCAASDELQKMLDAKSLIQHRSPPGPSCIAARPAGANKFKRRKSEGL